MTSLTCSDIITLLNVIMSVSCSGNVMSLSSYHHVLQVLKYRHQGVHWVIGALL